MDVRPGITDIASIVFSDESDILANSADPDIDYNQLIRPGKGLLGVYYVENRSIILDLSLIFITAVSIVSRKKSLSLLRSLLLSMNAPSEVIRIASRRYPWFHRPRMVLHMLLIIDQPDISFFRSFTLFAISFNQPSLVFLFFVSSV